MKKVIITLLCLAIVAGGSFGGYKQYKKKQDSKRVVDVVSVGLLADDYGYFDYSESATLSAQITSGNVQDIKVSNRGMIKEVKVEVGQEVKKGDVLMVYDTTLAELETQQKKNRINVLKQELAKLEKELEKIKKLRPSELAPNEDDEPYEPDYPEDPDDSEYSDDSEEPGFSDDSRRSEDDSSQPEQPKRELASELDDPDLGKVDESGAYCFDCAQNCAVTRDFMAKCKFFKRRVILNVYLEDERLAYCWELDFANSKALKVTEWTVNEGVTVDVDSGRVTYSGGNSCGAVFYVPLPEPLDSDISDDSGLDEPTDDSELDVDDSDVGDDFDYDDYDPVEDYDYDDNDNNDREDEDSEDYMYTRAELAIKVKEKEMEIKSKKLDIRAARIEYKHSKKKKDSGVEVAEIDGIVMKIGDESYVPESGDAGDGEDLEDLVDGDMYEEMVARSDIPDIFQNVDFEDENYDDADDMLDDGDFEDDFGGDEYGDDYEEFEGGGAYSDSYMVIQGSAGVSVDISVGELNLSKFPEGTEVTGISYDTGEAFSAVVTGVKDRPSAYYAENYGENPNSSTYIVTAEVQGDSHLSVGSWVDVNMPQQVVESDEGSSLYLPLHYCRQDSEGYYVMKADKKKRLKKQRLVTGKNVWGVLEVKSGVTRDDKICFPYGKDVKNGVRTKETDKILY